MFKAVRTMPFNRFVLGLGVFIFLLLSVVALVYFKERALLLDNAFQIFLMISDERIEIMAQRWPAAIHRVLPYVLMLFGASLPILAKGFSISYILWQLILFLVIVHWFRNPWLGLLQLAVLLLATSDGFFWCNSEQVLGLSMVILLLAVFQADVLGKVRRFVLLTAVGLVVLFTHPLLILPLIFVLVCDQVLVGHFKIEKNIFLIVFTFLWYLKRALIPNWYDRMKGRDFENNLEFYLHQWWEIPSLHMFVSDLFSKYHFIILGIILLAFLCIRYKYRLLLLLSITGSFLYVLIIHIGEPKADLPFYLEVNYYGLILMIYYLLIEIARIHLKRFDHLKLAAVLVFVFCVFRIQHYSDTWTNRANWVIQTITHQPCDKSLIKESSIPTNLRLLTWSIPYESILLGSMENINRSIHCLPNELAPEDLQNDVFHTVIKDLPSTYFENDYFSFPKGAYCSYSK